MAADPAKTVEELVPAVRQGEGALLMALDGIPVEQAALTDGAKLETIADAYAGLLRQVKALAAELGCGAPLRFSVRGENHRVVFAFRSSDLVLGAVAGPGGLRGQMRHAIAQAETRLGQV